MLGKSKTLAVLVALLLPLLAAASEWPIGRAATEARVPAGQIEALARVFAASSPAVIRVGWGIERNRNGGQALAAVMAIPALSSIATYFPLACRNASFVAPEMPRLASPRMNRTRRHAETKD